MENLNIENKTYPAAVKDGVNIKKYRDIENLRYGELVKKPNDGLFAAGDTIVITEKVDGSNASISYDSDRGCIAAYSRNRELDPGNTLKGFYRFALGLESIYTDKIIPKEYIVFGEWMGPSDRMNKITYTKTKGNWYVFDVWDKKKEKWLNFDNVVRVVHYIKNHLKEIGKIELAEKVKLVSVLYKGPFVSWEHCRSFMNCRTYGDKQEGIVVKNLSKWDSEERMPNTLKIVNEDFAETKTVKMVDPEKLEAQKRAEVLMESVCTDNRIEKVYGKLVTEGFMKEIEEPQDLAIAAKQVPKAVWEDILKEERDVVIEAGEFAGRVVNRMVMKWCKDRLWYREQYRECEVKEEDV